MKPYLKKTHHKKRAGGVAQGVGPSSSPSTDKKKKKGLFTWYTMEEI
jgi:hypothetical protein